VALPRVEEELHPVQQLQCTQTVTVLLPLVGSQVLLKCPVSQDPSGNVVTSVAQVFALVYTVPLPWELEFVPVLKDPSEKSAVKVVQVFSLASPLPQAVETMTARDVQCVATGRAMQMLLLL